MQKHETSRPQRKILMSAEESLRDGNLEQALAQLQDRIRKNPSDAKLRVFLFQLLSVLGQWERALTQLNVAGELDAETLAMVQTYREALNCEALRKEIFSGKRSPLIFGDPEEWIALMLEALRATADGQHDRAQEIRNKAFETAPATSGSLDGQPFGWIADADPRLGPLLEAIINGRYYWVPYHRLHAIAIEEPADLRDQVWLPANLTFINGGETVALLPTRYPGSEDSTESRIRLARLTNWQEVSPGAYIGLGQRMLATDQAEYSLMDVREIILGSVNV
jgi:type VI secretion system protein ImpE